jgi:hypothetical protein
VTKKSHDSEETSTARNKMEGNNKLSVQKGPGTTACPRFRTDISRKISPSNVKQKGARK